MIRPSHRASSWQSRDSYPGRPASKPTKWGESLTKTQSKDQFRLCSGGNSLPVACDESWKAQEILVPATLSAGAKIPQRSSMPKPTDTHTPHPMLQHTAFCPADTPYPGIHTFQLRRLGLYSSDRETEADGRRGRKNGAWASMTGLRLQFISPTSESTI